MHVEIDIGPELAGQVAGQDVTQGSMIDTGEKLSQVALQHQGHSVFGTRTCQSFPSPCDGGG